MNKKLTEKNKKTEILDSYYKILKQLQETTQIKIIEEKKKEEDKIIVKNASELSFESIINELARLKLSLGKSLDLLEEELVKKFNKFHELQKAIQLNKTEVETIHEISIEAESYMALIESQKKEKEEFENELDLEKKEFENEIDQQRLEWEKEKKEFETEYKMETEAKILERKREEEEYQYNQKITRQKEQNTYQLKKEALEKELQHKKETIEKELSLREKFISEKEKELADLSQQVGNFPQKLQAAIELTKKETTEKIKKELQFEMELSHKEMTGEKKLYEQKIAALDSKIKEQEKLINILSDKAKIAGQQVQDIALKAIEGASSKPNYYSTYESQSNKDNNAMAMLKNK